MSNPRDISQSSEGVLPLQNTVSPGKKPRKQGRGFFLTLLVISGIIIFCMTLLAVKGRALHNFTFKKFVINKALVTLLPAEYTLEEAEQIRQTVYQFYDHAQDDGVSDADLLEVSQRIKRILTDEKITDEEVKGLMSLIKEKKS